MGEEVPDRDQAFRRHDSSLAEEFTHAVQRCVVGRVDGRELGGGDSVFRDRGFGEAGNESADRIVKAEVVVGEIVEPPPQQPLPVVNEDSAYSPTELEETLQNRLRLSRYPSTSQPPSIPNGRQLSPSNQEG